MALDMKVSEAHALDGPRSPAREIEAHGELFGLSTLHTFVVATDRCNRFSARNVKATHRVFDLEFIRKVLKSGALTDVVIAQRTENRVAKRMNSTIR